MIPLYSFMIKTISRYTTFRILATYHSPSIYACLIYFSDCCARYSYKDALKVTRCLKLPSSDCVVKSVCAVGHHRGRERESKGDLHRLFVATSTQVYFIDDIVLHDVTSKRSSASDTLSDSVLDHVDNDVTPIKMASVPAVSLDLGPLSSADIITMDPDLTPVPVPVPVPVTGCSTFTRNDPLSVPVLYSESLSSSITYRTRQDLVALGQRELDLFNSEKPSGEAHRRNDIGAKNIRWPADFTARMEFFLNSR